MNKNQSNAASRKSGSDTAMTHERLNTEHRESASEQKQVWKQDEH